MKLRYLLIAILLVSILGVAAAGQTSPRKAVAAIQKQLAELNRTFTYKGQAVHPRAIKDLTSWVADPLPGPLAIDVDGTFESNRYFGDYETREKRLIFVDLTQKFLEDTGWFSYQHLGRLANGYHVLHTFDNGGGTGIFENLLLVECIIDYEYGDDGFRRRQLTIRRRGEFGLGDRYGGKIRLDAEHNSIFISADKRNNDKPYRITIR